MPKHGFKTLRIVIGDLLVDPTQQSLRHLSIVCNTAESCVRDDAWHAKSCLGKYVNSDGDLPADPIRVKHSHDATMDVHLNIERVHFLQDCQCFFFLPLVCPENSMKKHVEKNECIRATTQ